MPAPVGTKMITRDGAEVFVPAEQVADAYRTGAATFADGDAPVTVQGADGLVQMRAADAAGLFARDQFARAGDSSAYQAQQREAEFGGLGGSLATGAINFADAATLGLGKGIATEVARGLGSADLSRDVARRIQGYDETNQMSALVGQGLGLVAPALLTGGASLEARGLLGTGARALSAPTRALGALGEGAELLAGAGGKALGLAEGGLAARALGASARGAAEMSLYGVNDAWSRSKLEDRDLTGEQLLAAAGHGALMGGGLGGGLVLGGAALSKTLAGAGKGATALRERAGELAEKLGVSVPSAAKFEQEQIVKALGGGKKFSREFERELSDEIRSRVVAGVQEEIPKLVGKDSLATVSRAELARGAEAWNAKSGKTYESAIGELDALAKKAPDLRPNLDSVVERARSEVLSPLLDGLPASAQKKARVVEEALNDYVDWSARKGGATFEDLNKLRRSTDSKIVWDAQAVSKLTGEERAVNDALKDLRRLAEGEFTRAADVAASKGGGAEFSARWADAKADYAASRYAKRAAKEGAERELSNNSFGLGSMIAGGSGANVGATVGAALGPAGAFVGGLVGNAVGAVGGNLVKRYGNQLAADIAGRAVKTDMLRAVSSTLDGVVGGNVAALVRGRAPNPSRVAAVADRAVETKKRNEQAEYERRRASLAAFAAAPDATIARTLAGAPLEVRDATRAATVRGAEYLQSIAPKPLPSGSPLQPRADVDAVDPAARDRWLRAARAVDDPMSVLADARGGTLTREAVDAIKAVYPRIYGQIQGQVMAELAQSDRDLPYARAQQIGILLGVPADVSQKPSYLAAVQTPPPAPKPLEAGAITVKQKPTQLGSNKESDT